MATYRDPIASTESGSRLSVNGDFQGLQAKAGEAIEQAQHQAKEQLDQLQDAIRRNPLAAAGIAAGVGFVLALIARR